MAALLSAVHAAQSARTLAYAAVPSHTQIVPPGWRELLEQVLAGVPRLRGALCAGFPEIFDAPRSHDNDPYERRAELQFAKHCCRVCPALLDCARWVDSLPSDEKPPGVTAGVARRRYGSERASLRLSLGAAAKVVVP